MSGSSSNMMGIVGGPAGKLTQTSIGKKVYNQTEKWRQQYSLAEQVSPQLGEFERRVHASTLLQKKEMQAK
jgi:hypothetical protein